jgi:hypothetical protein
MELKPLQAKSPCIRRLGQRFADAISRGRLNSCPYFLFFSGVFIIIPCEAVLETQVVLNQLSKKRPKRPLFRQILIFSKLAVLKPAREAKFRLGPRG